MSRKNVPASAVREWFATAQPEGVPTPGSRGRLHPDTIAAFHKANKGKRYETASEAEVPTLTVKGVESVDSAGRKTTRTVEVTNVEARTLLGQTFEKDGKTHMQRGRVAYGTLALALSARNADAVADQFTK